MRPDRSRGSRASKRQARLAIHDAAGEAVDLSKRRRPIGRATFPWLLPGVMTLLVFDCARE